MRLPIADCRLGLLTLVTFFAVWAAGCDSGSTASDATPAADGAFGSGVVSGAVRFGGRAPEPTMQGGYQSLYVERVLQADRGADLDFLVGCRGHDVPRESH